MSKPIQVPAAARVMIGLCASPTLMVIGFFIYNLVLGQWSEIAISTLVFSALGLYAYFIVITGHLPFVKGRDETENNVAP